ncbi:integrase family protein [Caballeronia calidae]|uniref:Integrase family protein n=1 Tax=Caballeronia calidae TaxID=1777139 RepID=A0A158EKD5_9BURK|nr:tyrosine-type recombinase/integrase [Caballeronia calidae]SAL07264.1 integrase family protein [Caballeronia calidae]
MSTLRKSMDEYLTMRRRLGFKLHEAGQRLEGFVRFMERRRASHISASLALTWARESPSVQPVIWAQRLGVVRGFACYLSAFDSHTEIPPAGLLPHRYHRRAPYLYTDEETRRILAAALALPPASELRRWTYFTLIGLLSVTGLRPGEVVSLELEDVDLKECVLTVRGSKHGKSRYVPIHSSTRDALADYLRRRERCLAGSPETHLFVTSQGKPLSGEVISHTFTALTQKIGLRDSTRYAPRLIDYRHLFAVTTLARLARSGKDPERWLPVLSTFLGHQWTKDTYWYVEQHPELMKGAMKRLERRWRDVS